MSNNSYPDGSLAALLNDHKNDTFFIPSFQRGYRWGKEEIEQLIDDIWENSISGSGQLYGLQNLTVCLHKKDKNIDNPSQNTMYDVIDGQQRLTTIHIILQALKALKALPSEDANGDPIKLIPKICYEKYPTKGSSPLDKLAKCLEQPDPAQLADPDNANIDTRFVFEAFRVCYQKLQSLQPPQNKTRYDLLFGGASMIWYPLTDQASVHDDFANLNDTKLPLTKSELIKALFMDPHNYIGPQKEKEKPDYAPDAIKTHQIMLGLTWDQMEKALWDEDLWSIIPHNSTHQDTRIDAIMDLFVYRTMVKDPSLFSLWSGSSYSEAALSSAMQDPLWSYKALKLILEQRQKQKGGSLSSPEKTELMDQLWKEIQALFEVFSEVYEAQNFGERRTDYGWYHRISLYLHTAQEWFKRSTKKDMDTVGYVDCLDKTSQVLDIMSSQNHDMQKAAFNAMLLDQIHTLWEPKKGAVQDNDDGADQDQPAAGSTKLHNQIDPGMLERGKLFPDPDPASPTARTYKDLLEDLPRLLLRWAEAPKDQKPAPEPELETMARAVREQLCALRYDPNSYLMEFYQFIFSLDILESSSGSHAYFSFHDYALPQTVEEGGKKRKLIWIKEHIFARGTDFQADVRGRDDNTKALKAWDGESRRKALELIRSAVSCDWQGYLAFRYGDIPYEDVLFTKGKYLWLIWRSLYWALKGDLSEFDPQGLHRALDQGSTSIQAKDGSQTSTLDLLLESLDQTLTQLLQTLEPQQPDTALLPRLDKALELILQAHPNLAQNKDARDKWGDDALNKSVARYAFGDKAELDTFSQQDWNLMGDKLTDALKDWAAVSTASDAKPAPFLCHGPLVEFLKDNSMGNMAQLVNDVNTQVGHHSFVGKAKVVRDRIDSFSSFIPPATERMFMGEFTSGHDATYWLPAHRKVYLEQMIRHVQHYLGLPQTDKED